MAGAPSNFRASRFLDDNGITGGLANRESVNIATIDERERRRERINLVSAEAEQNLLQHLDDGEPSIFSIVKSEVTKHSSK